MRLFTKLFLFLALSSSGWAAVAANTYAAYFFPYCVAENSGNDGSGNGYNCTEVGTVPFNSGVCGTVGGTYRAGIFSDSNYYTAPASLGTALNGQTWTVVQGYLYLVNAASPAAFQTLVAASSTYITRLNLTNTSLRWDSSATVLEGGVIATSTCYHVAFVGTASTKRIYLDGVSVANDANNGLWPNSAPHIGSLVGKGFATYSLNGYLDNLRFSAGAGSPPTTFPTIDPAANTLRSSILKNNVSPYIGRSR